MLLDALRAHAGIALWPTGEQALANTQRLIDMARQFERGASSFRAFVNKLEMDAERGEADEAPIVEEGNYAAWLQQREALRALASVPSLTVKTVTSLARAAAQSPVTGRKMTDFSDPSLRHSRYYPEVQVEISARLDEKRPGGRRFGAVVHAMLASIDLSADAEAIQELAAVHQRIFGVTPEEIQAAIVTVAAALEHPILRRAAASARRGDIRARDTRRACVGTTGA